MMHGQEKSDRLTVPEKLSNKAERSAAQKAEGRSLAKGNLPQDDTNRMQGRRQVNKCPQADTSSSRARQEGEVHLAPAPYLRRGHASGGVLQPRAESRAGRRQGDLAALRRRPGGTSPGPVFARLDEKMAAAGLALTRFADDWVIICKTRRDAERALTSARAVLEGEHGLRVHPEDAQRL